MGFTARSALRAVDELRSVGVRAGLLRPVTVWPFPEDELRSAIGRAERVMVVEMNRGQLLREVQRLAPQAVGYGRTDGEVIAPDEIVEAVRRHLSRVPEGSAFRG
jgi:2-oxoglutarate ferredoxin oxidoreductase subunit alpha